MVDVKIEPSWKELLKDEFEKPYFSELIQFVKNEYKTTKIYPRESSFSMPLTIVPRNKPRSSFSDKTRTTVPVRRMDFVFLSRKVSSNHLHYRTFSKK